MTLMTETVTRTLGLPHRALTYDDLASFPDDGRRYELLDGMLIVSPPSPTEAHQDVVGELYTVLRPACPPELKVMLGPFDVKLATDTCLVPDLLVARRSDITSANLPRGPLLAVEVLSPSTRRYDLHTKRARYEADGTASYWAIDPIALTLVAWDLVDGQFVEVARVSGHDEYAATRPFPVTVRPGDLRD